ncbi:MAG: phage tail protein [Pseudomonadota bacterium]
MKYIVLTSMLAIMTMSAGAAPDQKKTTDAFDESCFKVEIEGVSVGTFTEVEGLDQQAEIIEHQDEKSVQVQLRPGQLSFGEIRLAKASDRTQELNDWWKDIRDGKYDRRTLDVSLTDDCTPPRLYSGFPAHWSVSGSFESRSSNIVREEITLIVERMELN